MRSTVVVFLGIVVLTAFAALIALPPSIHLDRTFFGHHIDQTWNKPTRTWQVGQSTLSLNPPLRFGLDIQGGVQLTLDAKMAELPQAERLQALESAKEVIRRRVDMYGLAEPVVQSAKQGENYRILVELAGLQEASSALELLGSTAQLDFRLQSTEAAKLESSGSASLLDFLGQFQPTGITGKMLKRATTQFDPQTGQPMVSLEFNEEGTKLFAEVTKQNQGHTLGIFLDEFPVSLPQIGAVIPDGRAVISGQFTLPQAKQLTIQLNAGALPVPVTVVEQRTIGASLGEQAVNASVIAGLVGLGCVALFMIGNYGYKGVLASISLILYGIYSVAMYKLLGVVVTLPGIAGLLLTVGMAVDANILIFERMKEELRKGTPAAKAMELGFGRAWNSIKDANTVTLFVSIVLVNPLDLPWLNTSGLVRGFGMTLGIGVLMSLFTSVVVTRTLMRLFMKESA